MIRVKLIYAAVLVIMAAFYVLFIDTFALLMLLLALALPVFLLLSLIWAFFTIKGELSVQKTTIPAGSIAPVWLLLTSRCPLFFSRMEAVVTLRHSFGEKTEQVRFSVPVHPLNVTKLSFMLSPEYCGQITICLEKLYLFDALHLFRFRIRKVNRRFCIIVLPEYHPLPIEPASPPIAAEESHEYDSIPGDDPSEILQIREYQPGDSVSRIHWKLSAKSDALMMKEFGRPIMRQIGIVLHFLIDSNTDAVPKQAKGFLELVYSISRELLARKQSHIILWCGHGILHEEQIASEEELTDLFCRMYTELDAMEFSSSALQQSLENRIFSSVSCITNQDAAELFDVLDSETDAGIRNLLFLSSSEKPADITLNHTSVFPILPDAVQSGIQGLVL